jgi:hypothetical protein
VRVSEGPNEDGGKGVSCGRNSWLLCEPVILGLDWLVGLEFWDHQLALGG